MSRGPHPAALLVSWKGALAVKRQPVWDEGVREVRRQSALQLADPSQGPDQGLARLAEQLGITRQAVAFWTRVPEVHVSAINRILGIPKYKLRRHRIPKMDPQKHKPNGRAT